MRFDTPIFFQRVIPGEYDPETGDYEPDNVVEEYCLASVSDTKTETLRLVYGEIKQGSLTVRLQVPYTKPFKHIRIGSKLYSVDFSRELRFKHTFIISEVQ